MNNVAYVITTNKSSFFDILKKALKFIIFSPLSSDNRTDLEKIICIKPRTICNTHSGALDALESLRYRYPKNKFELFIIESKIEKI